MAPPIRQPGGPVSRRAGTRDKGFVLPPDATHLVLRMLLFFCAAHAMVGIPPNTATFYSSKVREVFDIRGVAEAIDEVCW